MARKKEEAAPAPEPVEIEERRIVCDPIGLRMVRARQEVGPIKLKHFKMREEFPDGSEGDIVAQFDALSHHQVVEHCRPVLLKHGILFRPKIVHSWQAGNASFVIMDAEFVSADDPEQVFTIAGIPGQGNDYGDKGFGKAISYAKKMAYVLGLELSVGSDNEDRHVETNAEHQPGPQPPPVQDASPQQPQWTAPQQPQWGPPPPQGGVQTVVLSFGGPAQAVLCGDVFRRVNDFIHSQLKTIEAVEAWEKANAEGLREYWQFSRVSGIALRNVLDAYKAKLREQTQQQAGEAA